MSRHTVSSVAVISLLLVAFGDISAHANANRASALRVSPAITGGTSVKTMARTSTVSQPLTTQKITSTLKSSTATSGNAIAVSGNDASARRVTSGKPSVSYASSNSYAINNKIAELEDKIERLQAELDRKASSEAVANLLDKIYSEINGNIDSLQGQIDTKDVIDTAAIESSVNAKVIDNFKGLLSNYVTTKAFNTARLQLSDQITNNSEQVKTLRTDFENNDAFEDRVANSKKLGERIAVLQLATDSVLEQFSKDLSETGEKFGNEIDRIRVDYIPRADRERILADAAAAVDTKLVDVGSGFENIQKTLADTKKDIENATDSKLAKYIKAETILDDNGQLKKSAFHFTTLEDVLGGAYLKQADKKDLEDSIADAKKSIKDEADAAYAKISEIDGKVKTILDEEEVVTIPQLNKPDGDAIKIINGGIRKQLDPIYLAKTDRPNILDAAKKAVDDEGYLKSNDLEGKLATSEFKKTIDNTYLAKETILNDEGYLKASTFRNATLQEVLGGAYLKQADKKDLEDSIADAKKSIKDEADAAYVKSSEINDTIDGRINVRNFLTDKDLTAAKLSGKLGTTYVTNDELGQKGFLTDGDLTATRLTGKLGNAYVTNDELGKKGFLTDKDLTATRLTGKLGDTYVKKSDFTDTVSDISTNIDNLNSNLNTTVSSVNGLSARVAKTETSLKAVDTGFEPVLMDTTIDEIKIKRPVTIRNPSLTVP